MKKLLLTLFICITPLLCFSQGMKIKWEDSYGREFSINTHTREFQYSAIARDKMSYNNRLDIGPEGSIKTIGNVKINYIGKYEGGSGAGKPVNSVSRVGGVVISYNNRLDSGPEGYVKAVGGLKIYYIGKYEGGSGAGKPVGSIKGTFGSVN